jgi:ABC-type nitrate/sulfonate/bicarbonate transport system permease component
LPRYGLGILGLAAFATVWQLLDTDYLPTFTTVVARLGELAGSAAFWAALGQTVGGWLLGLSIAVIIGVTLGVTIGSIAILREFTHSTVEFLRPIPSVAFIPLVILLYGTRPQSTLILVVYTAAWPVLIQTLYGVSDVDAVARETTRAYHFRRLTRLRYLTWPSASPFIMTGIRLAASYALIVEIACGLIIGTPGIGKLAGFARLSGDLPTVYAVVMVAGLLGVAVNLSFRAVERRLLFWHASVRSEVAA